MYCPQSAFVRFAWISDQTDYFILLYEPLKDPVKSHPPSAGIIRSSPYSPR